MSDIGKIVWTDVTVKNADANRDFYKEVFNWTFEEVSMGDYSDYTMKNENGNVIGGICHKDGPNKDFPSQWINYIKVNSINDSLKKAEKLGGKIIIPVNPDSSYKMAVIEDVAGAYIGLFEE